MLLNILKYLTTSKYIKRLDLRAPEPRLSMQTSARAAELAVKLRDSAASLIDFGERNYLWYWRNDWILQWRRGVRGVEYSTLFAMLDRLDSVIRRLASDSASMDTLPWPVLVEKLSRLAEISEPFFQNARELLLLEGAALSRGPTSPLKTGDEQIRALREKQFSSSKRCGGLYEEVIELADAILLPLLREKLRKTSFR